MSDRIERLERLNKLKEQGILTQEQLDKEVELLLSSSGGDGQDKANKIEDSTSIELSAGVEIGAANRKFRLIKKIGSGGMGQVWQARDLAEEAAYKEEGKDAKHRYKALKVVNPHLMHSAVAIKQLQKEAMRAAELSHPNIINVHGWHKGTEGWLFVEMEYLQGHDLEEHLSDYEQGMSWDDCLKISQGIADGLDYAHQQQQIIHRDLKPSNIFITEQQQIKILDFGLAYQLRKSRLTGNSDSQSSGTTEYMPPEAFYANTPDARYDVYAFACLVYEMLTGQAPYSKEKAVKRDADEWPPKPEKLKDKAWQVLKHGLAYDKELRMNDVMQLVGVLQEGQTKLVHQKVIKKNAIADSAQKKKSYKKQKITFNPFLKKVFNKDLFDVIKVVGVGAIMLLLMSAVPKQTGLWLVPVFFTSLYLWSYKNSSELSKLTGVEIFYWIVYFPFEYARSKELGACLVIVLFLYYWWNKRHNMEFESVFVQMILIHAFLIMMLAFTPLAIFFVVLPLIVIRTVRSINVE